ncbi:unnamed protein product, partial [Ixodes hexagonus]
MLFNTLELAALVLLSARGARAVVTVDPADGGYKNILVAIQDSVPYNADIVPNIKALFRKASQFLLVATRGKFYFKDVMILVPSSWTNTKDELMWEDQYNLAEIQISDEFSEPKTLNPLRTQDTDPNPIQLANLTLNRQVTTTFREFRQSDETSKRVVLVLDVSYSMKVNLLVYDRMTFLQCAMNHMIRHLIQPSQALGIVTFKSDCKIEQQLVLVNTTDVKDELAGIINTIRMGPGTSIGCGLQRGTEVLEANGTVAKGGLIILVTDGEENREPTIADQLPQVLQKGIKVNTFALGSEADKKLEDIAVQTGGTAYSFGDPQKNTIAEMGINFLLSTTAQMEEKDQPVVV